MDRGTNLQFGQGPNQAGKQSGYLEGFGGGVEAKQDDKTNNQESPEIKMKQVRSRYQ